MRRQRVMMVLAGAAAVWCAAPLAATAAPIGTWHTAIEVPGLGSLNKGGDAFVLSVSCAAAGDCAGGGGYSDGSGNLQAFVVSESKSTWQTAIEVPGTGTLNKGGTAEVNEVSCTSAGNCAAGGFYSVGSFMSQVFVVSETNGTWGTAIEVPGTATLNKGGTADINSLSCTSAGNCAAGGYYTDGSDHRQAFVVSETNGTWRTAIEVPSTGGLNKDGAADINSVSCTSAGNCAAGGFYGDSSGHVQAFVVSETNGTWRTAIEVPSTGGLNKDGVAWVTSVSCGSAGNCAAGGYYTDGSDHRQAFVVSETNGTWRTAIEVPSTATLNKGGHAATESVACASAGNCAAGGYYTDGSDHQQAFVVSETNGTWGTAIEVPGSGALNKDGDAEVGSLWCASAGNCAGGGYYTDGSENRQALVASETNGTWGTAIEVPGSGALNKEGNAEVTSVSCASAGNCAGGGYYTDSSNHSQGFVVSQS
jgi:hypothetical protein